MSTFYNSIYKKQKGKQHEKEEHQFLNPEEQIQKQQIVAFQSHYLEASNCPYPYAVKVCMDALSKELQRIDRNEKLRMKFVTEQGKLLSSSSSEDDSSIVVMDRVKVCEPEQVGLGDAVDHTYSSKVEVNEEDMNCNQDQHINDEDEWENVGQMKEDDSSPLGRKLAEDVISCLSSSNIVISTPLAAIALALHCAMISPDILFKCTGCVPIKDLKAKAVNGFAKPIRELPRNMVIPRDWDNESACVTTISVGSGDETVTSIHGYVALRYRKDGVGNITLQLLLVPIENAIDHQMQVLVAGPKTNFSVHVQLLSNNEPLKSEPLAFSLDQYLNLSSFEKAVSSNGKVVPSLHFKSLPALLESFASYFDLGSVQDITDESAATDHATQKFVDAYVSMLPGSTQTQATAPMGMSRDTFEANRLAGRSSRTPMINDFGIPQRNSELFQGDFAGDLVPGGIIPPGQHNGGMGNLMGPNHPAFIGDNQRTNDNGELGFGGNLPRFGGLGMQPRFDPYGPPGGPTDPNDPLRIPGGGRGRGKKLTPPPRGGDPNPDHMKPPNDLSNNMFM